MSHVRIVLPSMVFQTNMTCKKERRSPAFMNADVWPCLSQISFIFSPDAVHFGQKTFETGCKTYKVPFILGRSVNWWLPCGDHFSHQGGSCHQCPWGPRLQLPKPGNFHTVQTCCRCRLSAPESAGPFEATQAPKNLSSSPWASAPFARRNTATASSPVSRDSCFPRPGRCKNVATIARHFANHMQKGWVWGSASK